MKVVYINLSAFEAGLLPRLGFLVDVSNPILGGFFRVTGAFLVEKLGHLLLAAVSSLVCLPSLRTYFPSSSLTPP